MISPKKFIVSHAPFWHDGSNIRERSYNTMAAALPALLLGFGLYGLPAVGVISLSISTESPLKIPLPQRLAENSPSKLYFPVGTEKLSSGM